MGSPRTPRVSVLSSDAQHRITQINGAGCEGWTAPSLWSVIKEERDMFIKKVRASVSTPGGQVIQEGKSLA